MLCVSNFLNYNVDMKKQNSILYEHIMRIFSLGFENEAYAIPNNYLPHSLIFSKTKNALNQQSKTPNVTTSASVPTHSDPKRKTYDYSNHNSQAYKNSTSQQNITMNGAK